MLRLAIGLMAVGMTGTGCAQGLPATPQAPAAAQAPKTPAAGQAGAPAPLKLYSLGSETQADPFPPVNPKYFTADTPSVATVEGYLKAILGFDPNRIWRVEAIQKTLAPGVSKVTAMVSERGPNAKVATAIFFVLPDGKHLIAGDATGVSPFGAQPFAPNRALLQARANGPARGSASKDLMLVEFADLQCPHCKEAQATMDKLAADFPKARIVFESFPLTEIHPFAMQAALYGACVAKQSTDAFFTYAQAVYDTQGALLPDSAEQTLKNAAAKAGADPAAIAACAASETAKAEVNQSMTLATDLGVDSTPLLAINGRMIGIAGVPYETLKQLIQFQAEMDGVSGAAASPNGVDLKSH
jgi:protein-disulfide isomerase